MRKTVTAGPMSDSWGFRGGTGDLACRTQGERIAAQDDPCSSSPKPAGQGYCDILERYKPAAEVICRVLRRVVTGVLAYQPDHLL